VAAPARPAARGRSPGAPPRPTLALLAWGCTLLATVVLVSLLLVIGGRDADATGDGTPDTPPTAPGHLGPAAISSQPGMNGGAPTTPVPGVTTTLPVVTTTATSRATTTTAPTATTTTASAPTTTEPPPPSTTEPPTPTTTEPVATGSARQLPPD
jgi:serine/threonine-protein kinase